MLLLMCGREVVETRWLFEKVLEVMLTVVSVAAGRFVMRNFLTRLRAASDIMLIAGNDSRKSGRKKLSKPLFVPLAEQNGRQKMATVGGSRGRRKIGTVKDAVLQQESKKKDATELARWAHSLFLKLLLEDASSIEFICFTTLSSGDSSVPRWP